MTQITSPPAVLLAVYAMRTRWELVLPLASGRNADLRAAGEEALLEIERAEQMLSAFRPDSELFHLNHQAQSDLPVSVSPRLFAFLARIKTLSSQTCGAFDPAIGPLLDVWEAASQNGRVPTDEEIANARQSANMAYVALDRAAQTVTFTRPGMRLNMGAVGKGWAADKAVESLRENGIVSALLHGGTSTVVGLGNPSEEVDEMEGWGVALQNPLLPPGKASKPLGIARLHNAALGVSAVHGKTYWANEAGQIFGHVLDARTGWPVQNTLLAAVITSSATDADALSTALLVWGEESLPDFAAAFSGAAFLTADENENRSLRVQTTPGFFV